MKKFTLLLLCIGLFQSCSNDEIEISESLNFTTATNLKSIEPKAEFIQESRGLYLGTVVTSDLELHGKIYVNAGNDSNYNALIEFPNGENISFAAANQTERSLGNINYYSKDSNSRFTLNIQDYSHPIITDFTIRNLSANMVLVKDDLRSRAGVLVGTYVDANDPTFHGTFDVFTNGAEHPYHSSASTITGTSIATPGGNVFGDELMENFDFSVCIEDISQTDFEPLIFIRADNTDAHFYADKQTSTVGSSELTWSVLKKLDDGYYVQFMDVPGFTDGCYSTFSGLWGWNGRYGYLLFEFKAPSDGDPSFIGVPSEPIVRQLSNVELTSEVIKAILEK